MDQSPAVTSTETAAGTATYVADVIVVGGGGSGLAAAISARETGRHVILLEKNPRLGGTTSYSVGSISAAATPHQIRRGIKDSPQDHYEDMPKFQGKLANRDNPELRKVLTDNVTDTVRWLIAAGIEFMGPMPEPPHRRDRMLNILPNSRAYAYHLGRHAERLGVDIRTNMRAEKLLREGDRIVGVRCRTPDGGAAEFRARGGVVLAAGDYAAGKELKSRFQSDLFVNIPAVNPTATGDGQLMALECGATIINGDVFNCGIRFVPPKNPPLIHKLPPWSSLMRMARFGLEHLPGWLIRPLLMRTLTSVLVPSAKLFEEGAILIGTGGTHIKAAHEEMTVAVASQPDQTAYILFDGAIAKKFNVWPYDISTAPGIAYAYLDDYRRNRADIFFEEPTLSALAQKLGVPGSELAQSIDGYNQGQAGKHPLKTPPFYALGPVRPYNNFTDGGLAVNERLEVLNERGRPIPGLFAAGATGQGGLILKGHGHHLGWAFTSGRIAGRNAAFLTMKDAAA